MSDYTANLDSILNELKREDLIISKNYTVRAIYNSYVPGKWPGFLSDAAFVDVTHLADVVAEFAESKIEEINARVKLDNSFNVVRG